MKSLILNIQNDSVAEKVLWMLEHFKDDGLEIISRDDLDDLKLIKKTRNEESISFEEYLNENRD